MPGSACPVCASTEISLGQRVAYLLTRDPLRCASCATELAIRRRDRIFSIRRGVLFQIIVVGAIILGLFNASWLVVVFAVLLLVLTNLAFELTGELTGEIAKPQASPTASRGEAEMTAGKDQGPE